jgi:hypothetical protein
VLAHRANVGAIHLLEVGHVPQAVADGDRLLRARLLASRRFGR